MEILRRKPWSRIMEQTACTKNSWRLLAMGNQRASVPEETICSFRHDINKRGKMTQSNPSPRSSTQQSVKNASRTRSPGGRSPSRRMSRWPCKDYLRGTCTTPFCEKWHPPECLFYKTKSGCRFGESAHTHTVRLMNSRLKRSKKNDDKSAVCMFA